MSLDGSPPRGVARAKFEREGLVSFLRGPLEYPEPPDGGWGHAVTFSAFAIYVTTVGLQYCVGLVYRALLLDTAFTAGWDRSSLAWVASIETSCFLGGQLLSGHIVNRYGVRAAVNIGCALLVVGFVSSALVTNPGMLFLSYGVLTGIGCSLPSAASIVLVQRYFKRKRVTASGFAVSGSGAGALALGPIVESIIAATSWRGACYFLAILQAAVLPLASLLLVPISVVGHGAPQAVAQHDKPPPPSSSSSSSPVVVAGSSSEEERGPPGGGGAQIVVGAGFAPSPLAPFPSSSSAPPPSHAPPAPPSTSAIRRSASTLPQLSMRQLVAYRPFFLYIAFVAVYGACWFVIIAHFITAAQESGTSSADSSLLILAQGVANTVGRAGLGALSDSPLMRSVPKLRILQLCVAGVGFATAGLSVFGGSFWYQTVYMVLNGGLGGSIVSLQAPITVDLVGLKSLPVAQGLFHMAQAPFVLLSPPIAGAMRAGLDDYRPVWMATGLFMCVSAVMCGLVGRAAAVEEAKLQEEEEEEGDEAEGEGGEGAREGGRRPTEGAPGASHAARVSLS